MGLGGALFEAIQFDNGRVLNNRVSKYCAPRFRDVALWKRFCSSGTRFCVAKPSFVRVPRQSGVE